MARRTVTVRRFIPAEQPVVFDLIADPAAWNRWAPGMESVREREGTDSPDGVGSIRLLGRPPVQSREEITASDRPHSLSYRLLSGLPLDDYRATVRLEAVSDGSLLTWSGSFEPSNAIQGAGAGAALRGLLGGFCLAIARHVSKHEDGDGSTSVVESQD